MIIKIQLSLATSHAKRRFLIYDKHRSLVVEGDVYDELEDKMNGKVKAYFKATKTPEGLDIGDEVEAQSW